jgi:HEAT repeat protein
VTALGQMGATQYFSPLVQLLGAEDNALAQQVQQALELLAKGPGMREVATVELTQVLDKGTGRARVGAALVCGRLQLKEAVPSLLYLIDDASPDVRANVAIALGDMRATEAVAPLTNRLVLEKDRWTKIQIIQAFEKIADKSTIPSLIDLLDDEDAQVRSRASNVLTNITRQRFGEDKSLWRDWWEKSGGGH